MPFMKEDSSTMDCGTYGTSKFRVLYRAPPPLPAALAYRDMLMRRQASLDERQRQRQQQPPQLRRVKSLPCQLPSQPAAETPQCDGSLGQPMQSLPTPPFAGRPAPLAAGT
ncbi:phosphatidylinositol 4-kinase alpha [Chlorella sorokiniana]|uniref:Phosphatidylinositol 4-kinase alpha n=1 Tax=Chlorella sorokiniana TaxID=3076 RepID=A0A2P6TUL3_CHLSO|nr:phosphatidylinositol 4-kinase alpha [Chlorella sorokiniana]|eukprot:PRW57759.1 phosphatidylinositol 4-kinase alpha [Chlorella sorokiniana]